MGVDRSLPGGASVSDPRFRPTATIRPRGSVRTAPTPTSATALPAITSSRLRSRLTSPSITLPISRSDGLGCRDMRMAARPANHDDGRLFNLMVGGDQLTVENRRRPFLRPIHPYRRDEFSGRCGRPICLRSVRWLSRCLEYETLEIG